ncbi:MAG: Lrp/AsnC ligand binding domain-containing protein [Candidatus Thermoplasmatota archaeon]|nr:Lrp/AsnC ligand binding domain-containing protein [Candidatus Thermoplasmatota archaeon]
MKIGIRKKYLFYTLLIISSLIATVTTSIDSIISCFYIKNPWIFGMSIFFVGVIITILLSIFLSIPFGAKSIGSRIDPSFRRVRLIKKEEIGYHVMAGIGNTVTTLGYLYILSVFVDPSAVLPFFQVVILYLLIVESLSEKDPPTLAEAESSIIVTFGAIMSSISLSGELNLTALLVIFLVINPGWVILAIHQRKLKLMRIDERPNDSINIRLWNIIFTAVFTSIIVFFYNRKYFFESIRASCKYYPWLSLTMGVTFFSYILYIRALGLGKASISQAVKASTIIFSIPFSILLSRYMDFSFSASPTLLIIKLMGIILVVLGVATFALTEVKAYVFIDAKGGHSIKELMQEVWGIRGITAISALAGNHDMLAKIRIRTLGKGYERIIRKLEGIEGIERLSWQSILKEWEKI